MEESNPFVQLSLHTPYHKKLQKVELNMVVPSSVKEGTPSRLCASKDIVWRMVPACSLRVWEDFLADGTIACARKKLE